MNHPATERILTAREHGILEAAKAKVTEAYAQHRRQVQDEISRLYLGQNNQDPDSERKLRFLHTELESLDQHSAEDLVVAYYLAGFREGFRVATQAPAIISRVLETSKEGAAIEAILEAQP